MYFAVKYKHYLKHATTALFIFGFLTDMVLLPDVNNPLTKYLGLGYILGVAILIAFREWVVARNTADERERKLFSLSSLGIAYFSGAALSFVFVYALRSAALSVSWPLFLILILCMVANEMFATHTYRFTIDIMVLFIAVVFYVLFNAPFIVNTQNSVVFYVSIIISILVSLLYVFLLSPVSETSEEETPRMYALAVGIPMFIGMLYFLNLMPGVPLSLTEGGVYHNVRREGGSSFLVEEEMDRRLFPGLRTKVHTVSKAQNDVFFLSAIRAPKNMTAPITHVWEYYDSSKNKWIESTVIPFTLSGGREGGYRAYSRKENIFEGLWRVTVKVDEKRIVGRTKFYIKEGDPGSLLEKSI
jgi:Protein of unknown function (DUF2914)